MGGPGASVICYPLYGNLLDAAKGYEPPALFNFTGRKSVLQDSCFELFAGMELISASTLSPTATVVKVAWHVESNAQEHPTITIVFPFLRILANVPFKIQTQCHQ